MGHAPGQHTGSESLGWWWETSRAQTKQRESPHSALLLPYLEMKRPKGPQAGHSLLRDRQSQVTVHREAQNRGSIAEPLKDTPAKPYGAHLQPLDLTGNPRVTGWLASPKAHLGSGLECPTSQSTCHARFMRRITTPTLHPGCFHILLSTSGICPPSQPRLGEARRCVLFAAGLRHHTLPPCPLLLLAGKQKQYHYIAPSDSMASP